MDKRPNHEWTSLLVLKAETAADLMTPDPLSIRADASVQEAVAFLIDKGISGAPVIDVADRPVGVLSQFDLLVHDREKTKYVVPDSEYTDANPALYRHLRENFQIEKVDRTRVRDVMTPLVFTAAPDTPAGTVVEDMQSRKIHRLFVVDGNGLLVGVISALDVLRFLRYMEPAIG
ncbi:MAG TPA: CBS domain-containing protein [Gemmataceae bacterium]|jgi:CBS domain-containing protein